MIPCPKCGHEDMDVCPCEWVLDDVIWIDDEEVTRIESSFNTLH
jgi:hypothetical protein